MGASDKSDRAFVPTGSSPQAVSPVPASIPSANVFQSVCDVLLCIVDRVADEGDRVYFGSTNDPHTITRQVRRLTDRIAEVEEVAQRAERDREYAIRWANQSVEMLQEAFFPLADALRALEAYLRNTPHHNAPEAAAARKALAKFDGAKTRGAK